MKSKIAVQIMQKDRHTKEFCPTKRKHGIDSKGFRFQDCEYFFHPDRFQIKGGRITYLYQEGCPMPLPVPIVAGDENGLTNLGIPAEELASIFNPWFFRIIGSMAKNKWEQIEFYANVGGALGIGYCIYLLHKLPDKIAKAIAGG